jgi:hypothetical protein
MPNQINIGTVTTPNPSLWVDTNTLGSDVVVYEIASLSPGTDWFQVNQFCSLLSLEWLAARSAGVVSSPYGISNFSAAAQRVMAEQLIAFDSLQAQVDYAAAQLNGAAVSKAAVESGMAPDGTFSYPVGTRIWAGNDVHVIAYYVTSATQYELYDSNTGAITTHERSAFATACTAFVMS